MMVLGLDVSSSVEKSGNDALHEACSRLGLFFFAKI